MPTKDLCGYYQQQLIVLLTHYSWLNAAVNLTIIQATVGVTDYICFLVYVATVGAF